MMDERIGRLHNRYRIFGPGGAPGAVVARLDRVAAERLPQVWDDVLAPSFGGDPAVYVIRRVEMRVALNLGAGLNDDGLVRRWGKALARSIVETIARDPGEGNLMKFTDEAEFVARFAADLARGRAWRAWYYGAFARLRPLATTEALRAVLVEHRDSLPAVLSLLRDAGALDEVLVTLDGPGIADVWSGGAADAPGDPRPLFATALDLADRLGLWAGTRPDPERLFVDYLASAPAPADWRDRRGLAVAVRDALRFLARRGLVRPPSVAEPTREERLSAALAGVDWLDADWLRTAVFAEGALNGPAGPAARPAGAPPPRQGRRLADLAAVLRHDPGLKLERDRPASAANALRLYAALIARDPSWSEDPMAHGLIERVLSAWAGVVRAAAPGEVLRALERGDTAAALRALPEPDRPAAAAAFRTVADLGAPGVELVGLLLRVGQGGPRPGATLRQGTDGPAIPVRCAGVFLLARAVLDVRLSAAVRGAGYPPREPPTDFRAWLAALALRWAGPAAIDAGRIDPGVVKFAGLEGVETSADLAALWDGAAQDGAARVQSTVFRTLHGLHLAGGPALHVHQVESGLGGLTLVGGDDPGRLWPLCRRLTAPEEAPAAIAAWCDLWREVTGAPPGRIVCDGPLADALRDGAALPREALLVERPSDDASPAALRVALGALEHGRLDAPGVDLTVGVAAAGLLRVWARWFRKLGGASVPYLLDNFVRRAGLVVVGEADVLVELEPGPMDVVIEMAGYVDELELVPWLDRRMRFRLQRT